MSQRPSPFSGYNIPSDRFSFYMRGDGARLRYAIFEPPQAPRGTLLIAEGRREFIEKKYIEVGIDLLARGFKVILFDWRGQGLSSRFLQGDRHQRDHAANLDIHIDDLRAFHGDVVRPLRSGPLLLFGHSLGALIAANWLARYPEHMADFKALLLTSPAFAIGVPSFSRALSHVLAQVGISERYAVGQHDYNDRDRKFLYNVLSQDPVRFAVIEKYFDANPDFAVGGVTWGWLATALEFIENLRKPGRLERLTLPTLALFGGRDIVIPPVKVIPLIRRMPNAEAVLIPGALHDLMNESDRYRNEAWRHIDLFLERVIRG